MYHGIIKYETLLIRPDLMSDYYLDLVCQVERDGGQLAVFTIPRDHRGRTNHMLIHHINELIRTYDMELRPTRDENS